MCTGLKRPVHREGTHCTCASLQSTTCNGSLEADAVALDGVMVYDPSGRPLAHIHLPERCANLCFGGAKRNRLFMAASHSLYALYVETRGAD